MEIRNISFSVRKGEILGISGLVGAGRTELAQLLFGAAHMEQGEIIDQWESCEDQVSFGCNKT